MATEQQIIDVQYDIKLAEQQEQLRTIFSKAIIGYALAEGKETFEEIVSLTVIQITNIGDGTEMKGLSYLKNLYNFTASNNASLGALDVSSNYLLTTLGINDNKYSEIIGLGLLNLLENLSIQRNLLTRINISNLDALKVISLTGNSGLYDITYGGNLPMAYGLTSFSISGCAVSDVVLFGKYMVDLLAICNYQVAHGGLLLSVVAANGGTNAIPAGVGAAAVSDMIALGVTVTVNS